MKSNMKRNSCEFISPPQIFSPVPVQNHTPRIIGSGFKISNEFEGISPTRPKPSVSTKIRPSIPDTKSYVTSFEGKFEVQGRTVEEFYPNGSTSVLNHCYPDHVYSPANADLLTEEMVRLGRVISNTNNVQICDGYRITRNQDEMKLIQELMQLDTQRLRTPD